MFALPDKTKIFLAAFWLWTWLLLQLNKLCSLCLGCILLWVPDGCIPAVRGGSPVKILKAQDQKNNEITNKMQLFLKLMWEKDLCDGKGGVDIDKFAQYVKTSVIWVAYILDCDLSSYGKDMSEFLRVMIIDVKNKLVRKGNKVEDLLFGEVNFHDT